MKDSAEAHPERFWYGFSERGREAALTIRTFPTDNSVDLHLWDLDVLTTSHGPFYCFQVVAHELAHFIDARCHNSFHYDDLLRPREEEWHGRHMELWDCYIDGRLSSLHCNSWSLAPYTLAGRQQEATIDRRLIERAWKGEFGTYPAIVEAAKSELRGVTGGRV